MKVKDSAIVSLVPAADHSSSEGYAVSIDASEQAAILTAATTVPAGVILDGEATTGRDTVGLVGFGGTFHVKLAGAVSKGGLGEVTAAGLFQADSETGARVVCVRFLEDGVADELVEAAWIGPIVYAS